MLNLSQHRQDNRSKTGTAPVTENRPSSVNQMSPAVCQAHDTSAATVATANPLAAEPVDALPKLR